MSCIESCLHDGDNGPEFYRESKVVSKNSRQCSGCPVWIPAGEEHQVVVGKWDGTIDTYRYHLACYALLRGIAAEEGTGWQMDCDLDNCSEEIVTAGNWPTKVTQLAVAVIDRMVVADVGVEP